MDKVPTVVLTRLNINPGDEVLVRGGKVYVSLDEYASTSTKVFIPVNKDCSSSEKNNLPLQKSRMQCVCDEQCQSTCSMVISLAIHRDHSTCHTNQETINNKIITLVNEIRLDERNVKIDDGRIHINLHTTQVPDLFQIPSYCEKKEDLVHAKQYASQHESSKKKTDVLELQSVPVVKTDHCKVLLERLEDKENFLANYGLRPKYGDNSLKAKQNSMYGRLRRQVTRKKLQSQVKHKKEIKEPLT